MDGKGRGVRHLIKNKTKKCFPGEVNVMGRARKMILKDHLDLTRGSYQFIDSVAVLRLKKNKDPVVQKCVKSIS